MKHTKGPWQIRIRYSKFPIVETEKGIPVAVFYEHVAEDDMDLLDNSVANSNLIAAAPEMLEALVAIVGTSVELEGLPLKLATQAIKKANGEL